jgi:hypothetical protein
VVRGAPRLPYPENERATVTSLVEEGVARLRGWLAGRLLLTRLADRRSPSPLEPLPLRPGLRCLYELELRYPSSRSAAPLRAGFPKACRAKQMMSREVPPPETPRRLRPSCPHPALQVFQRLFEDLRAMEDPTILGGVTSLGGSTASKRPCTESPGPCPILE